jgi:signal transduction histidine kinase
MALVYAFSLFGFAISILLVGFLTLIKRRDEIAVRFLIFCIDVFGWAVLISFWASQLFSAEISLWQMKFSHAFSTTIPVAWLHFVFTFSGRKEPFKGFFRIFYFISAFFSLSCFTPYFLSGTHPILEFKYYPSPGPIYHIFTFVFFILVPYAFWCLVQAMEASSGTLRKQYQYLIAAMIVAFLAGSTTFFPVYKIPLPLYLIPTMLAFPFLMGYALIKYGLFDVQQIADAFQREKLTAIGIVAASLNHELRNPLYIAKGKIESYFDGVEHGLSVKEEKSYTVLTAVQDQLIRASDIIQRFSDFAKPLHNSRDKERMLLKDTFRDVLGLVSNEFEMQKIKLNLELMDGITIHANRRQIEEIFFNLIINACHAMSEKGGDLSIKAAQSNDKVIIEIADTGPGIPEENRNKIFEPFFSTKGERGSGLGLYITKQLLEKNSGKISVKSKAGKGTSFILEFKR